MDLEQELFFSLVNELAMVDGKRVWRCVACMAFISRHGGLIKKGKRTCHGTVTTRTLAFGTLWRSPLGPQNIKDKLNEGTWSLRVYDNVTPEEIKHDGVLSGGKMIRAETAKAKDK